MEKIRLLLADDHEVVRAGIQKVLETSDIFEVISEVGDGLSLVSSLEKEQPDCLLLDISMPAFDPLATIPEIKKKYPGIKIIIVSAYDDEHYVQTLLKGGIDGYHLKDQPLSDLKLAIQRVMDGQRWISSSLISKLLDNPEQEKFESILSSRQRELLKLLVKGFGNQEIGLEMNLSVKTIENHLTKLYKQLRVRSRLEASNMALENPDILGDDNFSSTNQTDFNNLIERKSILLVDDNKLYLRQLQKVFRKIISNANIFEANNTDDAVRIAQEVKPVLALVDVVLGDEDGIRCTKRIKSASKQTRIVMISAYPEREFHRLSINAGAVAFLDKKDLDTNALRQVIEDNID